MKLTILFILTIFLSGYLPAQQKTNFRFSFGPKEVPGYIKVDPTFSYTEEKGYGFDFGTMPVANTLGIEKYLIKGLPSFNPAKPDPFETFSLPRTPHSPVIIIPGN